MEHSPKLFAARIGVIVLTPLLFVSCGQNPTEQAKDVVAFVNDEPIFDSELKRIMYRRARQDSSYAATPQDRQDQLDLIIDQKLIIQEAIDKGLAREEEFVDAIKAYWEQTLVREFIDYKSQEFRGTLTVSNEEVQEYYRHLDKRVMFNLIKAKDRDAIEQAHQKLLNKEAVALAWERIGPVRYVDLESPALRQAFELEVGALHMYEEAGEHYLVAVVQKEMLDVKPLESMRGQIEQEIIAAKEKDLFDQWLASKRGSANIKFLAR